jgi:hypothetical protein
MNSLQAYFVHAQGNVIVFPRHSQRATYYSQDTSLVQIPYYLKKYSRLKRLLVLQY